MNWPKFRRIIKWTLLTGFLLFASVIASISAIVFTEPGTRWVLQLATDYLPVKLGEIRGNLLTGLDLSYLEYAIEEKGQTLQRYRAENVSFRWQPLALFYSAVSVQSLTADSVTILLPPASDVEPEPMFWPSLALPVRIELGELQLGNIRVERNQGELPPQLLVELQRVSSANVSLGTFNLRISDLAVVSDDYSVVAGGRIALRYPYSTELDVLWQYELPEKDGQAQLLLSGEGEIEGDIEQLQLTHQLSAPLNIQSRIALTPNLTQPPAAVGQTADPYVEALNEWPAQALLAQWFPADTDIPVVSGELQVKGWLDDYQAELDGAVEYAEIPPLLVSANTRGNLQQIDIAELIVKLRDGAVDNAPATQVAASGLVTWSPALTWDVAATAADVNPASYLPNWPGSVQLAIESSGGFNDDGLHVTFEKLELDGQLRGLQVLTVGDLSFAANRWESQHLDVAIGANHVRLNGSLDSSGENLDLQWLVNAPLLHQLDTQLQGGFSSQGKVQGSLAQPRLQLNAQGENLRWKDFSVDSLLLALTPATGSDYELQLKVDDLAMPQQRIREIEFSGTGTLAQHRLQGHIESEQYGDIEMALDSSYREQRWQGQFTELDLRPNGLPRWWLLSSKPMQASAESVDLGELCLTTRSGLNRNNRPDREGDEVAVEDEDDPQEAQIDESATDENETDEDEAAIARRLARLSPAEREKAAVCARGQWHATRGLQAEGSIAALPLRQLRSYLKTDVNLVGVVDGDFNLSLPSDKPGQAQLNLQTREGALHYQYADNPLEVYRWETAVVTAVWQKQLLKANFTTDWAQFGNAHADVSLNTDTQALNGEMLVNFGDLSPLAAFLPFADGLSGQLAADIQLRGTAQDPEFLGELILTQGAATIPDLGLELRELGVSLKSFGDRIELRTSVRSGEGSLQVNGDMRDLGTPDWLLTGEVKGENFQLVNQTQLEALFSPSIELRANSQEVRLTGNALIPFARADIKSLPETATQVSDDVVIEQDGQTNGEKTQTPFFMNITAELGDDVRFNGFGLTSRLAGKMQLIKTPTRTLLTTGYVDVLEGEYRAYGQELTIDRGRLIFQGPYDNPGLDIRAQRILRGTEDSIVGLEIGGTLQNPTSSVYSNPALENEGEAMALLLTGKPLSEASAGDAYAIISAMSGRGMDGGSSITGKIADAFSLDEFAINAEDGFERSELWVGKYITEQLFVRYIVSLFEQEPNKVGVTYQMTDRLRVEGESGDVQSVDLIYKIER